jgi:phage shock protein A
MTLLERVAMLLHADLDALLAQAAAPEKALRQVRLDLQNQAMQVKTQLAIALADRRRLDPMRMEPARLKARGKRSAGQARAKTGGRAARQGSPASRLPAEGAGPAIAALDLRIGSLRSALDGLQQRLLETGNRLAGLRAAGRSGARARRSPKRAASLPAPSPPIVAPAPASRTGKVKEAELDRLLHELRRRRSGSE